MASPVASSPAASVERRYSNEQAREASADFQGLNERVNKLDESLENTTFTTHRVSGTVEALQEQIKVLSERIALEGAGRVTHLETELAALRSELDQVKAENKRLSKRKALAPRGKNFAFALLAYPKSASSKVIKIFSTTVDLLGKLGKYSPGGIVTPLLADMKVIKGYLSVGTTLNTIKVVLEKFAAFDLLGMIEAISMNFHHIAGSKDFAVRVGVLSDVPSNVEKFLGDGMRMCVVLASAIGVVKTSKAIYDRHTSKKPLLNKSGEMTAQAFRMIMNVSYLAFGAMLWAQHMNQTFAGIELTKTVCVFTAEIFGGFAGHMHKEVTGIDPFGKPSYASPAA